MTTAIDSLRGYLGTPRKPAEIAADCFLFGLFLAGVAYLVAKTYLISDHAEFDFRFLWVAGQAWQRGINPYESEYYALGKQLIATGYVPVLWVYPPNWVGPAVLISLVDLDLASFIWNIANTVMVVASSALLTAAFPPLRFENVTRSAVFDLLRRHLRSRWNVFFLHVWALATLQATALALSVGQTSIVGYFGVSLLLYGLASGRQLASVLGLAIVLLKPQLAATIVVVLMMSRAHLMLVLKATAVSAAISLPAFILAPAVAFDWLVNLTRYDAMNTASWPQSTTGIRHLIWEISNVDPGNILAMLIAIVVMVALYVAVVRPRPAFGGIDLIVLASAVAIAFAPLHAYDLPLVGVLLFTLARGRPLGMAVGLAGAAILWRAGDLAVLTGFYSRGTEHFEGTRLATLGAVLLLIAVCDAVRRRGAPNRDP